MADETYNPTTVRNETQSQVDDAPARSSNSDSTSRDLDNEKHDHEVFKEAENPNLDVERGLSPVNATDDAGGISSAADQKDPNEVDWDGPDDPERPINWSTKAVFGNIAIVSAITFLTPLASSMIAPGVQDIQRDFHNSNSTVASFIVSIYVLGYAFGTYQPRSIAIM